MAYRQQWHIASSRGRDHCPPGTAGDPAHAA